MILSTILTKGFAKARECLKEAVISVKILTVGIFYVLAMFLFADERD